MYFKFTNFLFSFSQNTRYAIAMNVGKEIPSNVGETE